MEADLGGVIGFEAVRKGITRSRDATGEVGIGATPVSRGKSTITVTNKPDGTALLPGLLARKRASDGGLPGPMYLVIDNLQNATLLRATGTTANLAPLGSPYIKLKAKGLATGKKLTQKLSFKPDADGGPITFTARLTVGPEAP